MTARLFLAALLAFSGTHARAQGEMVSTVGTEFWLGFMANGGDDPKIQLFISSNTSTSGTVQVPYTAYSQAFTVAANAVTTIDLPLNLRLTGSEIPEHKAILVQTEDPVSLYALNWAMNSADATAILPTKALGSEYRVQAYKGQAFGAPSQLLIVSTQDGTRVEVTPKSNTVQGHANGVPFIVELDSAETYQIQSTGGSNGDLTGTWVRGTAESGGCRPFAVFGGALCSYIPSSCPACDHLFDQSLPVKGWGMKYYTVPWAGPEVYTYRVLANTDGTTYTIDGAPQPVLNAGQSAEWNNVAAPKVIESNVPISVAQMIQGQSCSGNNIGDPALLSLNSIDQRIAEVNFTTIISPQITSHSVSIVVETASAGQVLLDGALLSASTFTPYAADPSFSYTRVALNPGNHRVACSTGVIVYVYGMGSQHETYAYSAGAYMPTDQPVVDTVLCGLDGSGMVTLLADPEMSEPWWSIEGTPQDTLYEGAVYTFAPPASNVYVVSGTENLSSCPLERTFSIELDTPPALTLSAGAANSCANVPIPLSVTADPPGLYNYSWSPQTLFDDPTSPTPAITPEQSGWYYVNVSSLTGCAEATDSIHVTVLPGRIVRHEAQVDEPSICFGDTAHLSVEMLQAIASDQFDPQADASLWAQITGGEPAVACGSVNGNALYFNGPPPSRQAQTTDLDVSSGGIIRFQLKLGSGSAPCEGMGATGYIQVSFSTNGGGNWTSFHTCYAYQYENWGLVELPIPTMAQTASTRFRWAQPTFAGQGQDNWAMDNVVVAVKNVQDVAHAWSPAALVGSPSAMSTPAWPNGPGWFQITTTDLLSGCTYADSVFVTIENPGNVSAGPDTTVCDAMGLPLHVVHDLGPATVQWGPPGFLSGANTTSPIVQHDSTMTYWVTVTGGVGCPGWDTVQVIVPFSQLETVVDTSLCQGGTILLDPGVPQATHAWSTGATTPSIAVSAEGTYTCTLTDPGAACTHQVAYQVAIHQPPTVDLGADTALCAGESLTLNAGTSGPGILWSTGATGSSITVGSTGTYSVSVTDQHACTATDTIEIIFHPLPLFSLHDTAACISDTVLLDAGNAGSTYLWMPGGASTQEITVHGMGGTYSVVVSTPENCVDSASVNIGFIPFPVVDLGPDTALCDLEVLTLNAGCDTCAVWWSTGSTAQQITVTETTDIRLEVDNGYCMTKDSLLATFHPLPDELPAHSLTHCFQLPPTILDLDAGNPGSSFAWQPGGDTSRVLPIHAPGVYSVVITNQENCTIHEEITVKEFCPGTIFMPNTFTPDGDGINDVLLPLGNNLAFVELYIFDRWGQVIAHGTGNDAQWDGMAKNEPCPIGVYAWQLNYRFYMDPDDAVIGMRQRARGHVTLLR